MNGKVQKSNEQKSERELLLSLNKSAKKTVEYEEKQEILKKKIMDELSLFRAWFNRFCRQLGRAFLIAFVIRILFEIAPDMKNEFPKVFAWYDWMANCMEELFKFFFGLIGSLLKGELAAFNKVAFDGFKELFTSFVGLF